MDRRSRIVAVLFLAALCPFAAADEPPAGASPPPGKEKVPGDPPTPAPAGGPKILRLGLADAARMGAAANLEIQEGSYDTPMAYQDKIAACAEFDTLLTAGFSVARTEVPFSNTFFGQSVFRDDTFNSQVGATRRLRSGGSVSLLYRADRLSTNSPFASAGWTHGASIEASQPLLRGAGETAIADIRRAQNALVSARAGYETQIETTLLRIIENYAELVFADENLDARNKSEEVARELLDDANSRLAAEVGTPLDVAEARAGVERRRSEVFEAQNLRETIEDQLLALIMPFDPSGRPAVRIVPTDTAPADPERLPGPGDEQRYVQTALQGRPEMQAARADIATRGIDTLVARDAIRPQLDVLGRVATDGLSGGFGGAFTNSATGQAVSGSIGIEFSLFIGQRAARARWLRAAWGRRQAVLRKRELENQIIVEVRAALRDLDTARGQLSAARAEVAAAREGLEGEILRREQGKSTPFRVLQKEEDLTGARTRAGRASADLRIAEGRLWRAVGALATNLGIDARRWAPCATGACR